MFTHRIAFAKLLGYHYTSKLSYGLNNDLPGTPRPMFGRHAEDVWQLLHDEAAQSSDFRQILREELKGRVAQQ